MTTLARWCAPSVVAASILLAAAALPDDEAAPGTPPPLRLGAFSVSLAVEDIQASRAFYEQLGFQEVGGDATRNWLILRNGTTTIGLFQGLFEANILTFNPGWDWQAEPVDDFQDVRAIQRTLKERGLELLTEADEATSGPASFVLADPDGNMILFDQHVPRPED